MIDPQLQSIITELEKHIGVLNEDYTKMSVDVAILKAQMGEIMWWFKAILGAMVVLLTTQFWQVVIMRKKEPK